MLMLHTHIPEHAYTHILHVFSAAALTSGMKAGGLNYRKYLSTSSSHYTDHCMFINLCSAALTNS